MKKITLFFAALAVTFSVSAALPANLTNDANAYLGVFDPVTKKFTENTNETQIVNFNPSCFTFAILVYAEDILETAAEHSDYTLFLNAVRTDDGKGIYSNANGSWEAPYENFPMMTRVDDWKFDNGDAGDEGIVFYICGYDLGTLPGGFQTHLQTNVVFAPADPEVRAESDNWVADAEGAGLGGYLYLGDKTQAMGNIVTTCPTCSGGAGIADIIAAEQEADIVGYYSILGAQLAGEPASGIYLVKFSNGKTVKLVK